jgi:hypothetical protein
MPTACMNEYMIVEPTNVKPRFLRSLLSASEMKPSRQNCQPVGDAQDVTALR